MFQANVIAARRDVKTGIGSIVLPVQVEPVRLVAPQR